MVGGSCPTCKKKARHQIDRFSELPEHILRRVLSLVDSKTAVQTSLLSRRWRSVWKGVPTLNLYSKSLKTHFIFRRFVSETLSRRYATAIEQISLEIGYPNGDEEEIDDSDDDIDLPVGATRYRRLFSYAASHGGIQRLRLVHCGYRGGIWNHFVRSGSPAAFGVLATLHLDGCKAYCFPSLKWSPSAVRVDPFADFPNLKDLTLKNCSWAIGGGDGEEDDGYYSICLRVSGIQLRNLKIERLYSLSKVEIFAPNLESFYYTGQLRGPEFAELQHMICLDLACIRISGYHDLDIPENRDDSDSDGNAELVPVDLAARRFKNLFQGLHSARTLELHLNTFKILERIQESKAFQTSPFTRLKTLIINVENKLQSFDMPYRISQYFLGNSTNKEVKSTKFKVTSS
ncbi:unnamed protein product [Linum tenue]|uniref:F-box domain-containing protein n=1 Tax=Linum tenue TaxID=586396 RepID=A0AAV0KLL8_9ROSI|nr:unnamed protein product [Linum tenue]